MTEKPLLQQSCKLQLRFSLAVPLAGWWGFNQEGTQYKNLQEQTSLTPQAAGCVWVNLCYQKPGPSLHAQARAVKGRGSLISVCGHCSGELQDTVKSWQIFSWANWLTWFFLPKFDHVPAGLALSCTISTTFWEPVSALELDLKGQKKSSSAKAEDGTWIQLCMRTDELIRFASGC